MMHERLSYENEIIKINNEPESVVNETNLEFSASFSELQTIFIPSVYDYIEEFKSESELITTSHNDNKYENNLDFAITETEITINTYVETFCMHSVVSVIDESDCLLLSV